ncbi:hypothetical protein [Staphylococcus haemolyticus]|uniref:hypothetical protein n=1 Tax=Staphylococcus haemolyticus TaxID=1283 RepID=UPI000A57D058|nr:hypothetical protein [Staphylococcus haemolyticus]MCH4519545.1 hypothetical protein [Staphylococcus haemolyticus]
MSSINLADLVDKSMEYMSENKSPRDIEICVDVKNSTDSVLYIDESEIHNNILILKN